MRPRPWDLASPGPTPGPNLPALSNSLFIRFFFPRFVQKAPQRSWFGPDTLIMKSPTALNRSSIPLQPSRINLAQRLQADVKRLDGILHDVLGDDAPALISYRRAFEQTIPRQAPAQRMKRSECIQKAARADIVYCADNHSTHGAQNVCRELLEQMRTQGATTLVLEIGRLEHQPDLDAFSKGEIGIAELEKRLNWGFDFHGYGGLLLRARELGVPLRAANSAGSLQQRDQVAADVITNVLKQTPDSQVLVLFGKLHLGKKHLPALVAKTQSDKRTHTVLTGDADSYHMMVQQQQVSRAAQLSDDTFCVYAVKPRADRKGYIRYLADLGVPMPGFAIHSSSTVTMPPKES